MKDLEFVGELGLFSSASHRLLRYCGRRGNLSLPKDGEYFSFVLRLRNNSSRHYIWKEACVRVDGGQAWHWAGAALEAFSERICHIYPENMKKCLSPGTHTAVWYLDGRPVHQERFVFFRETAWQERFPIPSQKEIAQYRNPRSLRSPYIAGWLSIPPQTRFTEYTVDFQAGLLPKGTYGCLGYWSMELAGLKGLQPDKPYAQAYAGVQRLRDGQTVGIMSFWDVFCTDRLGRKQTLRPELLYPKTAIGGKAFTGEGTGARCLTPFQWESGRWYRMHLRSFRSPETGTTLVEQWILDPDTGEKHLLCCYDTKIPNSAFEGSVAVFLENFTPDTAGEVRSMVIRDPMYRRQDTGAWERVSSVYVHSQDGLPHYEGSYAFGAEENRVWMITSGVGGDWFHNGKGRQGATFELK